MTSALPITQANATGIYFVARRKQSAIGESIYGSVDPLRVQSPPWRTSFTRAAAVHRYFRHPGTGIKIKSSASVLGAGIDVRGDGGMVVAPPSVNADAQQYAWLNRGPVADMPTWLVELTRDKPLTISQRAVAAIRRPVDGPNRVFNRSDIQTAAPPEWLPISMMVPGLVSQISRM